MSVAPESSKKPTGGISPQFLLDTIRLHPIAFLCLLVASLSAGAAVYFLYPSPKNTAIAVFQLFGNAPRVITPIGENAVDLKTFQDTQVGLIKSRKLLQETMKIEKEKKQTFLRNHPNPEDWLDHNLKIDFKKGPQYMKVYLEGDYPDDMKTILESLREAYLKKVDAHDDAERKANLDRIGASIVEYEGKKKSHQDNIDRIAKVLHASDEKSLLLQDRNLEEDSNAYRRKKEDCLMQLEIAKRELPITIRDQVENMGVELKAAIDGYSIPDPVIDESSVEDKLKLHSQVTEAEKHVSQAKERLAQTQAPFEKNATNPSILRAQSDVAMAEAGLKKTLSEIRSKLIEEEIRTAKKAQRENLKRLADVFNYHSRNLADAERKYNEVQKKLESHYLHRAQLDTARKGINNLEGTLDMLYKRKELINIEARAPRRVDILDEPFVVAGVEGFKALRISLLAGGGLFTLGFALLVFWESRLRRVNRTEDLAPLGLAILGTLPQHEEINTSSLELMEAVDSTRTLLLRSHSTDRSVRVLAVTSGMPGEGKTSLSSQLAISLSRAGYRTLLVDGDVHAPRIHELFKLQPSPGLCEVLRDEVPLCAAIQTSDMPGLFVMPAGSWSMIARQFLVGDRWPRLRRDLESQFDFVVIDTAPLLMMTDTMLLALRVDGVVLSVLAGMSRMAPITQTKERLESLGVRVLGIVMNGVSARFPGYHYGPYAGKYSARYDAAIDPVPLAALTAVSERPMEKSS